MTRLTFSFVFSLVLLLICLTHGCADLGEPPADEIVNYSGTITEKLTQFFVIESDIAFEGHLQTFYPLNLPEDFKKDGLRIRFSGNLEIKPTLCYEFPPIRLSHIEVIGQ